MEQLYAHQRHIIESDPNKALLALGTGAGKGRICLEMAEGLTLVVVPKQIKLERTWEKNAEKFDILCNLLVVSKEEFRRDWKILPACDTFIADEVHTLLGVYPETRQKNYVKIPKTSQLFQATLGYLQKHSPKRVYLASATPITKPMHLWALATLLGKQWDFFAFRDKYYFEKIIGSRRIWLPRNSNDLKARLVEVAKQFGYFGTLDDWFDVPDQIHEIVPVELTTEQKQAIKEVTKMEVDPMVKRAKLRTIENGILYHETVDIVMDKVDKISRATKKFPSEKIEYIVERAQEFKKILIFANYIGQVHAIAKRLQDEGYNVITLTGGTKDRSGLIAKADASDACIVVAQASISAGYELPSFPCVIFASKSYRYVDYEQALGRVLRANALKKNLYIHLVVPDSCDAECHKSIMAGQNFQELLMEG